MNNLISIQAAINAIENTDVELSAKDWDELTNAIKSVTPEEPRTGKWIPFEYGDETWHKCSVCGIADKYIGSMPRPNGTIAKWEYVRNYCPNCGAKMRGEEE